MFALDLSKASMSHTWHYRVLPWMSNWTVNLLVSIAEVLDRKVAKTGKSAIF